MTEVIILNDADILKVKMYNILNTVLHKIGTKIRKEELYFVLSKVFDNRISKFEEVNDYYNVHYINSNYNTTLDVWIGYNKMIRGYEVISLEVIPIKKSVRGD